jgi:hypothetical protein
MEMQKQLSYLEMDLKYQWQVSEYIRPKIIYNFLTWNYLFTPVYNIINNRFTIECLKA